MAKVERANILIVDDHPSIAFTLAQILKLHGYNGFSARSLREALRIIHEVRDFQVAIIDLEIEGKDQGGLDVSACVTAKNPFCMVILTSGYLEVPTYNYIKNRCFRAFQKPIEIAELLATLKDAVKRSREFRAEFPETPAYVECQQRQGYI